ncbi:MAG: histidinol-phosphate transaminase [Pseudomonadota bacterium]
MKQNGLYSSLATPGVQGLQPYQPGKPVSELERELGIKNIIKLASNENPLGPSPRVLDVIRGALGDLARYPDGSGFSLKDVLASNLNIGTGQITLGNGSNDVLEMVARTFLSPGEEAVFSRHAFAVYPIVTQAVGARARVASATPDYGHDLEAMAALVGERTRVVFIANPNNPTGTYLERGALNRFLAALPERVVCVVDEAYFEYVEAEDYPDCVPWVENYSNLVVTRTFSKAYALAGLRVGYAVSNLEIADLLNRVRQPFNVNSLALLAAEAALRDQDHLARSIELNRLGLRQLNEGLGAMGLRVLPSVGNFVCVDVDRAAAPVYQDLLRQGVIVRPVANYELPNHLRVTVGTQAENDSFIEALAAVLDHD